MTAIDLLRIACGLFFVPHIASKLRDRTPTVALLASVGLPRPVAVAWVAIVIEILAAIGLVLGIATVAAASAGAVLLLGAALTVLKASGGAWRWNEGGAEYPAFWSLCCFTVAWQG